MTRKIYQRYTKLFLSLVMICREQLVSIPFFRNVATEKYSAILKKLATQKPTTRDEKRIAALFSGKNKSKRIRFWRQTMSAAKEDKKSVF